MAIPPQFQKAHDRQAGKHPTPLSPKANGKHNPLSSLAAKPKNDSDGDDKKKAAMLAAFKGRH